MAESDIVIPLEHQGRLRLYRDRRPPKIWIVFAWGEKHYERWCSASLSPDDISPLIATISEAKAAGEPRRYKTYTDHLFEFHPEQYPQDRKQTGRVAGTLWMSFHNLKRSHDTKTGRLACMLDDEAGRFIEALRSFQ